MVPTLPFPHKRIEIHQCAHYGDFAVPACGAGRGACLQTLALALEHVSCFGQQSAG